MNDPFEPSDASAPRGNSVGWIVAVVVVAVAAIGLFVFLQSRGTQQPEPVPPPMPVAQVEPPVAPPAPAIQHPIEAAQPDVAPPAVAPLPALDESDAAIAAALTGLAERSACERFLLLTDFVRRVVAAVDNLTRSAAPQRLWPVKPTDGRILITEAADVIQLSPENFRRYTPALGFMESLDTGKLAALYVQYYPLFQEAYRELGYPEGDFNTRLVEVIDGLLATPDIAGPVLLHRHALIFKFADPELEARSVGQKALIRMGSANAGRVKAKLRDLRRQLTQQPLAVGDEHESD